MNKELIFLDTLKIKRFGNYILVLQVYGEYNEKEIIKDVFNVSFEYEIDNFSSTLDIFETYNEDEAIKFFNMLVEKIKITNGIEEI